MEGLEQDDVSRFLKLLHGLWPPHGGRFFHYRYIMARRSAGLQEGKSGAPTGSVSYLYPLLDATPG